MIKMAQMATVVYDSATVFGVFKRALLHGEDWPNDTFAVVNLGGKTIKIKNDTETGTHVEEILFPRLLEENLFSGHQPEAGPLPLRIFLSYSALAAVAQYLTSLVKCKAN